jgi:hypothetical protein
MTGRPNNVKYRCAVSHGRMQIRDMGRVEGGGDREGGGTCVHGG